MFQSPVSLHFRNCVIDTEIVGEEQQPVAVLKLVLEPFTPELARELSDEIADHCFTKHRKVRSEIDSLTFDLDEKQQFVTVKMAEDSEEASAVLRYVRVPAITIAKRGGEPENTGERKKKKVAPPTALLRATLVAMVPPDTREIQEFLCRRIKSTFVFQFESEIKELQFGPTPKADAGDEDPEQLDLDDDPPAPRLVKPATKAQVIAALSTQNLELLPKYLVKLTPEQRTEIVEAVDKRHAAEKDGSGELSLDELNARAPLPSYVMNPAELLDAPAPDPEAGDVLEDQPTTKPRAKRRSSAEFQNTVGDQQKAKRKGKK